MLTPVGLSLYGVTRNADHIICLESLDHSIGKKIVIHPHIVMDEHQKLGAVWVRDACVEDCGKALLIRKGHLLNQTSVILKSF